MEAPTAEPPTKFNPDKVRLRHEVNKVTPEIESKLGIKFKDPPKKARIIDYEDIKRFTHENDNAVGIYLVDTNTYYHWEDGLSNQLHLDNYFIELHEIAHAYVEQEYPPIDVTGPESAILQLSLHEGVADWMATETLARLDPATPSTEFAPYHFGAINGLNPGIKESKIDEPLINSSIDRVYTVLANIRRQERSITPEVLDYIRKQLESDVHILGHYYTYYHMQRLTSNGLSIADALKVVIKNPPTRVEQLLASKFIPMAKAG